MTDATLVPAARDYLDRLDAALVGVDASTRAEIVAGVREVLIGRDADAVDTRIRELGDPGFIAAEARAVPSEDPTVAPEGTLLTRRSEPAALAIVAAVLVMIGGALVPVLGAVVGYVLMWISTVWTTRQKLVATLIPVGIAVTLALVLVALRLGMEPSGGEPAAQLPAISPSMVLWNGLVLAAGVQLIVGIWLLVLARRSWAARA